jgi:hypothetical protein
MKYKTQENENLYVFGFGNIYARYWLLTKCCQGRKKNIKRSYGDMLHVLSNVDGCFVWYDIKDMLPAAAKIPELNDNRLKETYAYQ